MEPAKKTPIGTKREEEKNIVRTVDDNQMQVIFLLASSCTPSRSRIRETEPHHHSGKRIWVVWLKHSMCRRICSDIRGKGRPADPCIRSGPKTYTTALCYAHYHGLGNGIRTRGMLLYLTCKLKTKLSALKAQLRKLNSGIEYSINREHSCSAASPQSPQRVGDLFQEVMIHQ